jgi:hypothetical protein
MTDPTPDPAETPDDLVPDDDRPPDESTLLGAEGVEAEVLAELARAEGEMAEGDEGDSEGAQV